MNEEPKTPDQPSFAGKVYQTFDGIDVSPYTKKRQQLDYLPWATAWGILMEHFPESEFRLEENQEFPDGSVSVATSIAVREGENVLIRSMWLPVMDHRHLPVVAPHARQINDARMRCLVKNMALFGIGRRLYSDEEFAVEPPPSDTRSPAPEKSEAKPEPTITKKQAENIKAELTRLGWEELKFCTGADIEKVEDLKSKRYAAAIKFLREQKTENDDNG